ncbi:unnamed protein product, partial [Chrysoparadoxa australica]
QWLIGSGKANVNATDNAGNLPEEVIEQVPSLKWKGRGFGIEGLVAEARGSRVKALPASEKGAGP